jgi:hypothetical protein
MKMDKETYKKSMKSMYWKGNRVRCCYVCGLDDPDMLEEVVLHHVDGRANSDLVIDLCKNHHDKVHDITNKAAPNDKSKDASKQKRRGMQLITQAALFKVIAEHQIALGREMIDDDNNSS